MNNTPTPVVSESLRPYIDRKVIPGAVVAVANVDRMLALEAIGSADLSGNPMPVDAMFWIASMTKPINASAVMMLVDEGKICVDDPVEKYLPEFKAQWLVLGGDDDCQLLRRPKNPLRVRHLLGHTGGLPFRSPMEPPAQDVLSLVDAIRIYAQTPLQSEPGAKYAYGNVGPNTAGRIVEVVSGLAYEEFMQKRVFDALGMSDTTFFPTAEQIRRMAQVVKPNADATALEAGFNPWVTAPLDAGNRKPFPGGGLFSTASDIAKFGRMILGRGVWQGRRLISEATLDRFTQTQPGECPDGVHGMGFAVGDIIGHGGAYSTNVTIDHKTGLVMVYMVQLQGTLADAGAGLGAFRTRAAEVYRR